MKTNTYTLLACAALAAALPLSAQTALDLPSIGTVQFVPAAPGATAPVSGNTRILNADGTLGDAAWSGPADTNPAADQPLWRHRTTWGGLAPQMPGFFTNGNGNIAIMPDLNTTVGVAKGDYAVYVLYTADRRPLQPEWNVDVGNAGGSVAAALSGGELTEYNVFNGKFTGFVGAEINNQLGYAFNMWGVFASHLGTVRDATSISVDIAPFVGDTAPGGTYRPSYHGIAYVPFTPGPGVFSDYALLDSGYVDTGAWMGWVWVTSYPWVWSVNLSKYIYAGGDNWFYIQK